MSKYDSITNSEDIIDSRDMLNRLEYLEDVQSTADDDGEEMDDDDAEELGHLRDVIDTIGEDTAREGIPLIRDGHFAEYAEEFARDIHGNDVFDGWPGNCIDWDQAADELKADFSSVDFDDETYWYRA